ncbi:gamma-glutamylcyclotransferase family protein [Aromatoleum petrolei]|uniref:Putative gamma-glutamylcyclotransferase n=1 Tax=Aromatoleum petrolei TaxID=76116 RepID=A0ABX1MW69_9RHOO|nr:gamma-glutamylcyclotransferase family protein [Aromatoleum petrolei]NMF90823.1 gamma-glutamylcyclotransferase [Aromatoleum petrolei]QTQ35622.1 Putative gamma-glutamylcyclotransferase, AIG2-like [Aromatoleum petrolei]
MQHCFTYGSLMCEDIMSAVTGARSRFVAASLDGYRRQPVRGQAYPGMVPATEACVPGVLYLDLPASAWLRLDRFEGEEYERRQVVVRLQDGRTETAWTYVFRPGYAARLVDGEWEFERFLRTGKARFTAQYVDSDALEGDGPA